MVDSPDKYKDEGTDRYYNTTFWFDYNSGKLMCTVYFDNGESSLYWIFMGQQGTPEATTNANWAGGLNTYKRVDLTETVTNINSIKIENRKEKSGSLIVKKTVITSADPADKEYKFTIEFENSDLTGRYGDLMFRNGSANFTLKKGESIEISSLPVNLNYKIYEIDDSLSCVKLDNGNYLLGVHIASILSYFPYDSEVVQNAIGRNQSIYLHKKYDLPDGTQSKTVPIFPYEFSTDAGSLTTGEPKFARSYYFEIDKDGNVVNEVFYKSIITNSRTTTFDEVNRTLKDGSEDKRFEETVRNLKAVTDLLSTKNKSAYIYEQIKENTEDYSDLRVKKSGAQNIVYQAMMLTGHRVAEFFARNNYPFIYRVHEVNEENAEKLEFLIETLNKSYGGQQFERLYHILEGVYPKGWYAMEGRHSGLGLEHYCHCTSGLRRAADIVAEHALEVCYDKTPTAEELEELRIDIEEKIRIINEKQKPIEWFAKEYKKVNRRHR